MGTSAASAAGGDCGVATEKQPEFLGHHWRPEAWARALLAEEEVVVGSQSHDAEEEEVVVVERKDGCRCCCTCTEGSRSRSRRPSPALALARRRVGVAMKSKLRLKNKKRLHHRPPPLDLDPEALATEVEKILRLRARTHAEQQQEVASLSVPGIIQPDLSACSMSTLKQIKQRGFSTAWLDEVVLDKSRPTHAEVVKRWPLDEKEYQKRCTITKVHEGWTTRIISPADGRPFDPKSYGTVVQVAKGVWELKDHPVDLDAIEAKLRELGYTDEYCDHFRGRGEMPFFEAIKGYTTNTLPLP